MNGSAQVQAALENFEKVNENKSEHVEDNSNSDSSSGLMRRQNVAAWLQITCMLFIYIRTQLIPCKVYIMQATAR